MWTVIIGVLLAVFGGGKKPPPDSFVDEVLGFFDSGAGPIPGPYGRNPGGKHPEKVAASVILGPVPPGPLAQWNREARWLSLPAGSHVIVGWQGAGVKDQPGPDLIIHSLDPSDSAGEKADVYVSEDGRQFVHLGRVTQGGPIRLDLARIGFTGTVRAVKIVGLDNGGSSPGFDLVGVQAAPPPAPLQPSQVPPRKQ
jgi:hypothetical protein